jgi:hypothetical protein
MTDNKKTEQEIIMTSTKKDLEGYRTIVDIHGLAAEFARVAGDYFAVYGDGNVIPRREDQEAKKLRAGRDAVDAAAVLEAKFTH